MGDEKWLRFPEAVAFAERKGLPQAKELLKDALTWHPRLRHRYGGKPPYPYPAVLLAEIHPADLCHWVDAVLKGRPFESNKNKNPGGRPQKADWGAFYDRFVEVCKMRGLPDKTNVDGWQTQADVEEWLAELAQNDRTPVGDTQIRDALASSSSGRPLY